MMYFEVARSTHKRGCTSGGNETGRVLLATLFSAVDGGGGLLAKAYAIYALKPSMLRVWPTHGAELFNTKHFVSLLFVRVSCAQRALRPNAPSLHAGRFSCQEMRARDG